MPVPPVNQSAASVRPAGAGRGERCLAAVIVTATLLLPLVPDGVWAGGIWRLNGIDLLLAAAHFSLPMALSLWTYLLARPAALAGAALATAAAYSGYAAYIYGTASSGGGASFMGLWWLVFWSGCAAALLLPLPARPYLRASAWPAAVLGFALQAAMFGLPLLLSLLF